MHYSKIFTIPYPGVYDGPSLSRVTLRPHRVLAVPPAIRFPSWYWRWSPSLRTSRCLCAPLAHQNQRGTEWSYPQEEVQKSRVELHHKIINPACDMTERPGSARERRESDVKSMQGSLSEVLLMTGMPHRDSVNSFPPFYQQLCLYFS